MRITVLTALVLLATGCTTPKVTPESVGLSGERLTTLDQTMEEHVQAGHVAGGLSLVFKEGRIAHFKTYGSRSLERAEPMTEDTIFRIYSMSKTVTSVAVMMLIEAGKVELSTPLSDLIPAFGEVCVYEDTGCAPLVRPIEIRDLLTHTAGLSYGEVLGGQTPVDSMYQAKEILWGAPDLEGFASDLATIPLLYQPGEEWHYSVSIDLLGRVVEVVSGQRFDVYLQEHIFDPLGMIDTGFVIAAEDTSRLAGLYFAAAEDSLAPGLWDSTDQIMARTFFSGGGGLLATAGDYLRFSRMLLNGGELEGVRILSEETVDLMMQNQIDAPYRAGYGFGLGGQVVLDAAVTPEADADGVYSWSGAANTFYFVDRENELIAFLWVQLQPYGAYDLGDTLQAAVYEALLD